jgi:hypothetical protein
LIYQAKVTHTWNLNIASKEFQEMPLLAETDLTTCVSSAKVEPALLGHGLFGKMSDDRISGTMMAHQ